MGRLSYLPFRCSGCLTARLQRHLTAWQLLLWKFIWVPALTRRHRFEKNKAYGFLISIRLNAVNYCLCWQNWIVWLSLNFNFLINQQTLFRTIICWSVYCVNFFWKKTSQNRHSFAPNRSFANCFINRPRLSESHIRDQEVCKPSRRHRKPDKFDTKTGRTNQGNWQTNREVDHICNEKWSHDPKSSKDPVGCHLDSHEDEKVANPSHIAPRHLICQSGSIFAKE